MSTCAATYNAVTLTGDATLTTAAAAAQDVKVCIYTATAVSVAQNKLYSADSLQLHEVVTWNIHVLLQSSCENAFKQRSSSSIASSAHK